MIEVFNEIKDHLLNNKIEILNKYFEEIIRGFNFLFHTEDNPMHKKILTIPNILKIIVVDQFSELDIDGKIQKKYYMLCFSNIFLIINEKNFYLYQDFFIKEKESTIFNLHKDLQNEIKKLVSQKDQNISLKFCKQIEQENLIVEIDNFFGANNIILSSRERKFHKLLKIFNKNILAFLIRKSYIELITNRKKSMDNFLISTIKEDANINEYVFLRTLKSSNLSLIDLTMNINNGQLFVLKKHSLTYEQRKLFEREKNDYLSINHPLLLRYFGTITEEDQVSLILEFVNGETLLEIDLSQFDENAKLNIIFSIMIIIQYLHFNGFIYRDLKPNNLMIDQNNSIVLIDLDRMVKNSEENTGANSTHSFAHDYSAPEICIYDNVTITEKVDIYSLGWLINFILNNDHKHDFKGFPSKFIDLCSICKQCVDETPENRPTISKVISTFVSKILIHSKNSINRNLFELLEKNLTFSNDVDAFFTIGLMYSKGICVEQNIEKAIELLSRSADQNHADSLFELGKILDENSKYKDTKKAHELFQKSADLGNQYGQLYMGIYYFKPENKNYNFQKAFHYFKLSADQKNANSCYFLGQIYFLGKDVPKDIIKGIQYFTIAAKGKIPEAQYKLGVIYFEGQYVKRNSEEAIKYLTAASDQNICDAQYYLGSIYYEGKNFIHDEEKAIHFATLAANQNNMEAQRLLGQIYLNKIPSFKVTFDGNIQFHYSKKFELDLNIDLVEKSIHYFAMAARQNDFKSINILKSIYMYVNIDSRNNKKYQYYKTLTEYCMIYQKVIFNRQLIEYDGQIYGQNIEEVMKYLSDLNDAQAKFALGLIYLDDVYVERNIEKTVQYFSEAANQGYLKAQKELASLYIKGRNVKQDIEKGIDYLFKSAKQNDFDSQLSLLEFYTNGKYFEPDMNKVNEILNMIENQKNIESLIKFSNIFYEGKLIKKDINQTIKFLEIADKLNCSDATVQLGLFYYEGKDVKQNYIKSYQYFFKSAKMNNSYGLFYLGLMHFDGKGVKKNYFKSLHYFLESAKQRNKYALVYIALFLLEGKYIQKDVNRALNFLKSAFYIFPISIYIYGSLLLDGKYINYDFDKGLNLIFNSLNYNFERSYLKIGMIYFEGKIYNRCVNYSIYYFDSFITMPLNEKRALLLNNFREKYQYFDIMKTINIKFNSMEFKHYLVKASQNDPVAQFIVGSFYYEGKIVERNINKAIKYYYYSAIQGYKDSMLALGVIFSDGKFIERKIEKAINFLSRNKFSVNPVSLFINGSLFYEGKLVKRNIQKAINFFRDASNLNNCFAKNNLGVIYRNGIQVPKNQTQSIEYFNEAIKIDKNDFVSSYNLAHILFFEKKTVDFDDFYQLLIHSANRKLFCAFELLCLIVYKKYGYSKNERNNFEKVLKKYDSKSCKSLSNDVFNYINIVITDSSVYENLYEKIKNVQLIYIYYDGCIFPLIENEKLRNELCPDIHYSISEKKMIDKDFYDGFGYL